jgi:hypothetical protein
MINSNTIKSKKESSAQTCSCKTLSRSSEEEYVSDSGDSTASGARLLSSERDVALFENFGGEVK